MDEEIMELQPSQEELPSGRIEVDHELHFTMIDGKVMSAVTNTASAATCPICKATPKIMNNLEAVKTREVNEESLKLGLTCMHCYIRVFEMLLNISIRLSLPHPTWQITGQDDKEIAKRRKKELQRKFKEEWGMTVMTPNKA